MKSRPAYYDPQQQLNFEVTKRPLTLNENNDSRTRVRPTFLPTTVKLTPSRLYLPVASFVLEIRSLKLQIISRKFLELRKVVFARRTGAQEPMRALKQIGK